MKIIICDLCKKPLIDEEGELIVRRKYFNPFSRFSNCDGYEFRKLDICKKCANIIVKLSLESREEDRI